MKQKIFNSPQNLIHRKTLRNNLTQPEQKLWAILRGKQLGVKFRRQHGIGCYIVDFYSAECKLVIEVDGDSHYTDSARQQDAQRDMQLQRLGLQVLRFTNEEITQNMAGVYEVIKGVVESFITPSQPPP